MMEASNPQQQQQQYLNTPVPSYDATQRIQQLWLDARREITELEANNNMDIKTRWGDFMHGMIHEPTQPPVSFYKLFMEIFDITKSEFRDEPVDSNNKKLIREIETWRRTIKECNMIKLQQTHMQLIEIGIDLFNRWETPMLNKSLICVLRKKK